MCQVYKKDKFREIYSILFSDVLVICKWDSKSRLGTGRFASLKRGSRTLGSSQPVESKIQFEYITRIYFQGASITEEGIERDNSKYFILKNNDISIQIGTSDLNEYEIWKDTISQLIKEIEEQVKFYNGKKNFFFSFFFPMKMKFILLFFYNRKKRSSC